MLLAACANASSVVENGGENELEPLVFPLLRLLLLYLGSPLRMVKVEDDLRVGK